ncbi:Holliday junction resolvase RuvX [Patescibacteria group bacterium]
MNNFLGIDWGISMIGLSLADEETRIAFAYDTLKNDNNFFSKLSAIIKEELVGVIVLGVPVTESHNISFNAKEVGARMEKELGVKVFYQDEMFTTKIAEKNLINRDLKKIKRFDNQESARIILQDWLDKK